MRICTWKTFHCISTRRQTSNDSHHNNASSPRSRLASWSQRSSGPTNIVAASESHEAVAQWHDDVRGYLRSRRSSELHSTSDISLWFEIIEVLERIRNSNRESVKLTMSYTVSSCGSIVWIGLCRFRWKIHRGYSLPLPVSKESPDNVFWFFPLATHRLRVQSLSHSFQSIDRHRRLGSFNRHYIQLIYPSLNLTLRLSSSGTSAVWTVSDRWQIDCTNLSLWLISSLFIISVSSALPDKRGLM